ncbi:MAG: protease SohB [Gammaproteobacteria bacterium]|nr:protease SohB [Gammaproteobacteria bacterium]
MEYLIQYGMFLAKAATLVVAIVIVLGAVAASGNRQRKSGRKGQIKVTHLNEHYDDLKDTLRHSVLAKEQLKQVHKNEKKQAKLEAKEQAKSDKEAAKHADAVTDPESGESTQRKKRVYVLTFTGNIAADEVTSLREEITAVLTLAEPSDEVVLRLESPGGMVHAYGLASSQLLRIKSRQIPLTICVDKVAASGGYMMACLADRLVSAPFAIIGSIGVLVQLPNFHRVLKKNDIDYEIISAGEFKRTLTQFGEITQKGRDKVQEEVETMHDIFKAWIKDHRPSVDIDKIATGETWVGTQAKERYMVDEIKTSDECIVSACETADVYEVEYELPKSLQDKIGGAFQGTVEKLFANWIGKSTNNHFQ